MRLNGHHSHNGGPSAGPAKPQALPTIGELLRTRSGEEMALNDRYLNPQMGRILRTLGFDKTWVDGDRAHLIDADGQRYLDYHAAFGPLILGHNHPVVNAAVRAAIERIDIIGAGITDLEVELAGGGEVFPHGVEVAFNSVYDKLLRAIDGLELSRDLLASVRDYHQAKIANDQNEVMKRLTVIASLLLLPTFIVGLYGQNFRHHFPELGWQWGYLWSWALILATTVAQLVYFRRKRWI